MATSLTVGVVAAAAEGGGWAFEQIYREFAPAVAGYLRTQGAADPEGAANEVFLRAFRRMRDFRGTPDQLRSWIFTIAHNLLVDERRFAARRPREARLPADLPGPAGDAEADAMASLEAERMRALLGLLPDGQRDVLLLRVVADLSLEDTAAAMGRSTGAVKALQHRALEGLRRLLADAGGVEAGEETALLGVSR